MKHYDDCANCHWLTTEKGRLEEQLEHTVTLEKFKKAIVELYDEEYFLEVCLGPKLMELAMSKLAFKLFGDQSLVKEPSDHKPPSPASYALNNIEKFRGAMDEMPEE